METSGIVRRATEGDLEAIARINSDVFLGDRDRYEGALQWVTCWHSAFPLYQYFVNDVDGIIAGYAGWQLHGGFHRAEPVIELDQLGINPAYQKQGRGPILMDASMDHLTTWIQGKNDRIESHVTFVVWAYAMNFNAISAYTKTFGDGMRGFRIQFGDRAENMLRVRRSIVRPVRDM